MRAQIRTEGFWDGDMGISLRGCACEGGFGGAVHSHAGTATVSLHGERKRAPKKGGGRVQTPKLISCWSQTQPRGRSNMCVCLV